MYNDRETAFLEIIAALIKHMGSRQIRAALNEKGIREAFDSYVLRKTERHEYKA